MTRRDFQCVEGGSSKFWTVWVEGTTMHVHFGKIGTNGQKQAKEFPSEPEAKAAAQKLIVEKTKKGYTEVTTASDEPTPAPAPKVAEAPKPVAVPTSTPPASVPALPATVERRLLLTPEHHAMVRELQLWPETEAKPWPEPPPFDLAATLAKGVPDSPLWGSQEAIAPTQWSLTAEEVRFWFHVVENWHLGEPTPDREYDVYREREPRRATWYAALTPADYAHPLSVDDYKRIINGISIYICIEEPLIQMLAPHLDALDWVRVACETERVTTTRWRASFGYRQPPWTSGGSLAHWYCQEIYPRLSEADRQRVRDYLVAQLQRMIAEQRARPGQKPSWSGNTRKVLALAGVFGVPEVRTWIEAIDYDYKYEVELSVGWVIFSVRDSDFVQRHIRRLRLGLRSYLGLEIPWVVHTGITGVDYLIESYPHNSKSNINDCLISSLMLIESPETAEALLRIKVESKSAPIVARIAQWLEAHPAHAIAGLTPLVGEKTKLSLAAAKWLEDYRRRTQPANDDPAPGEVPAPVRAALDATKPGKKPLPEFAAPQLLPTLPGLRNSEVARILVALRDGGPLVEVLKTHGDREALAAFAWDLFERWLGVGAPAKEKWAFTTLASFGDDTVVANLTPMIRAWPGEAQHQRAVTGLEVLRGIGTDFALTQLNGIALKLKFKGLQERARQMMDLIAQDRGLSRAELEDRIVPDLDLQADGSLTLDFGPRQFQVTIDEELTPRLRDASGKVLKDLPKAAASDDAEKANEAIAQWKAFKKQWRETIKIQTARLEEAMVLGRGWTVEQWQLLLATHPLMQHLVRRVVWQQGERFFRLDETGQTVAADDGPVSLEPGTPIRIAHRLRLTESELRAWIEAMQGVCDEQPFEQLARRVFVPEANAGTAVPFPTMPIPAASLRGGMEKAGWLRILHDHGGIYAFYKPYPVYGVLAVMLFDGIVQMGYVDDSPCTIERAFLVPHVEEPDRGYYQDEIFEQRGLLPVASVDAVAYSETVRDLMALAPSGKA